MNVLPVNRIAKALDKFVYKERRAEVSIETLD